MYYHPACTSGYSYYYSDCCNAKWYIAWNVLLWIAVFMSCLLIGIVTIRTRKEKERSRKETARIIAIDQNVKLIADDKSMVKSEASSRFSVPMESSMVMKAPKNNRLSYSSSNDNRDTAASADEFNND